MATKPRANKRLTPAQAKRIIKNSNQRISAKLANLGSIGEETLAQHLKTKKVQYIREYKFNPCSNHRADFFIPECNLLIEVEGGTRGKSRHTTHEGYSADLQKYNMAQILGFSRLAFTTEQVNKGTAIIDIMLFIKSAPLRNMEALQAFALAHRAIEKSIYENGRFTTLSGDYFAHHVPTGEEVTTGTPEAILEAIATR